MKEKTDIDQQNQSLKETSHLLFGDRAELRIVAPRSLRLLKENARYFKKGTFKQLVENVKNDQRLSSVPLCFPMEDGGLEVLSGNHRVKASIEANIPWIMVIVILEDLTKSKQIAVQLSHNSLVGVDDQQLLANLWAKIDDIKSKCYAGLSSEEIGDLKDIKLINFSTPTLRTKHCTFAFTDFEFADVEQVMEELNKVTGEMIFLAPMELYEPFFRAVQKIKKKANVKNASLAVMKLIEFASQYEAQEVEA